MTMSKQTIALMLAATTWLTLVACDSRTQDVAVAGAPPVVDIPVGPVPGPAELNLDMQNPMRDDPVALMEGRRLFVRYNCSGCHGGHAGGGMGPSLRDASWIYGGTDPEIFDSIAEGRAHGMPTWRMLARTDLWKLVGYITALRTAHEPEPPQ
jgi:cytochrome c oxidase cbb3-type subunit 3